MSERQQISSETQWEKTVGYSRAVRIGNIIEVSGTTAVDRNGVAIAEGNAYQQTIFIIKKILATLHQLGAGLEDIVRTRIYVTDMKRWKEVGRAHQEMLGDIRPATTMVEVSALIDTRLIVEIEATAILE